MVGVVIKGADSAIYGEDTCTLMQYAYCTVQYTFAWCNIRITVVSLLCEVVVIVLVPLMVYV